MKQGKSFGKYTAVVPLYGQQTTKPVVDKNGRHLVKVQVAMGGTPGALVYNSNRSFVYHGTAPSELMSLMQGRPKAFFWATITGPDNDRTFGLDEEAPWQDW